VVVIAGVPGWLLEDGPGQVLHRPQIGVGVVALDLVGGGGAAPEESVREGLGFIGGGVGRRGC